MQEHPASSSSSFNCTDSSNNPDTSTFSPGRAWPDSSSTAMPKWMRPATLPEPLTSEKEERQKIERREGSLANLMAKTLNLTHTGKSTGLVRPQIDDAADRLYGAVLMMMIMIMIMMMMMMRRRRRRRRRRMELFCGSYLLILLLHRHLHSPLFARTCSRSMFSSCLSFSLLRVPGSFSGFICFYLCACRSSSSAIMSNMRCKPCSCLRLSFPPPCVCASLFVFFFSYHQQLAMQAVSMYVPTWAEGNESEDHHLGNNGKI